MVRKKPAGHITDTTTRLKLHPYFPAVIYAVNQHLKTAVAVVDGRYGLSRNGPLQGDVVELDWIVISDDIYATDLTCCRLMQIDKRKVAYLRYLENVGALPHEDSIVFNQDYRAFATHAFYLKREWTDYPGWLAFQSSFFAYWAYRSPLAGILHRLLYLFREPFY